jgi:hypothetical protein
MGGIFNTVNSHLYHYAGNNPVKYTDPDGRNDFDAYDEATNNKYFLIISINLPGKDQVESTISPVKKTEDTNSIFAVDGGHAFVTLEHIDLKNSEFNSDSFGLYPAEGSNGIMLGKDVPGDIRDDSRTYADITYSIPITKEGYQSAMEFGKYSKTHPPEYNLYKNNCTNFVGDLAKSAGVNIPIGGYFGRVSNPSSMQVSMRAMKFWGLLK